ncbi:DUF4442 domain-containing protein [Phragmitibacter flavus]|uniref:DUF4442 domain-containing protein n=1 Tax=Phragmitibacter flavus TaxID=2576071 RepID=A0A5R8KDG5_9BACT|nr:YiiD C-terminal domain-containing protein [Phragmitibacter flavus]TLD70333.1 DUF4442 domain-containing protein [Phragmitibacter flavus]
MDASAAEAYFHQQMPLTKAMGLRVESCDADHIELSAPLELNHNHLGTAFGGSLAALATSAGYGMLWTILQDPSFHLVIRNSSLTYHRPVRGPIRAICRRPDEAPLAEFQSTLAAKGRARIDCEVHIEENGERALTFIGTFVAIR